MSESASAASFCQYATELNGEIEALEKELEAAMAEKARLQELHRQLDGRAAARAAEATAKGIPLTDDASWNLHTVVGWIFWNLDVDRKTVESFAFFYGPIFIIVTASLELMLRNGNPLGCSDPELNKKLIDRLLQQAMKKKDSETSSDDDDELDFFTRTPEQEAAEEARVAKIQATLDRCFMPDLYLFCFDAIVFDKAGQNLPLMHFIKWSATSILIMWCLFFFFVQAPALKQLAIASAATAMLVPGASTSFATFVFMMIDLMWLLWVIFGGGLVYSMWRSGARAEERLAAFRMRCFEEAEREHGKDLRKLVRRDLLLQEKIEKEEKAIEKK